jgi:hypothetical protein
MRKVPSNVLLARYRKAALSAEAERALRSALDTA